MWVNRRVFASIALGLAIALAAGLFSLTPTAERLENQYALGLLYAFRQPVRPPPGAIIVAVDRQTLSWLRDSEASDEKRDLLACLPKTALPELDQIRGPGSLPRSVHACLLKQLKQLGFRVVVFDILFAVPGSRDDDESLAAALHDFGRSVILVGFDRSVVRDGASEVLIEHQIEPLELYQSSATSKGAFIVPRTGGPVYGYWVRVPGFPETKSLPQEALQLFREAQSNKETDGTESEPLRYLWLYGSPGSIPRISVRDVLRGNLPDELRKDAASSVAFVGASDPEATNFPDTFPAFFRGPSDADISGTELAATAFLNLLHQQSVHRLSAATSLGLIMLFAGAVGILARANARAAMFLIPSGALACLAAGTLAFLQYRLFLPLGTLLFVVTPASFLLATINRYRFARRLILHLAPAPVARRMLARPSDERGVAVSDQATVVFFDLIGSTAIAEMISAVEFSTLLNVYHETVTRAVASHRGFISAYSGDGVMAVFTSGDAGSDHALCACRSVLAAIYAIRAVNVRNAHANLPALEMRVGLNSGMVAEGEIGARDRFNFSVVGDVVNLAARLERLGKTLFPGEKDVVLVGPLTKTMAAQGDLHFINCGSCSIPGRASPELVYRLAV